MELYYDPATETAPIIKPGNPPVDQTVLVSQLQAQIVTLTGERDARQAAITAMKAAARADDAADAANAAGQGVLAASGGF